MPSVVIGDYSCPVQIGNRLHVLLNAKLCADLYDVPLVWRPNTENGPFVCPDHLVIASSVERAAPTPVAERAWPYPFSRWSSFRRDHVPAQRKNMESTTWWSDHAPRDGRLYCGRMERPIMGAWMRESRDYRIAARINSTFARGDLRAYGQAFHALFRFARPSTSAPRDICVHMRYNVRNTRKIIANVLKAANAAQTAECTAFVASNVPQKAIASASSALDRCEIEMTAIGRNHTRGGVAADHGAVATGVVDDVERVRNCRRFFGSRESSLSELMAELVLFNGGRAQLCDHRSCRSVS